MLHNNAIRGQLVSVIQRTPSISKAKGEAMSNQFLPPQTVADRYAVSKRTLARLSEQGMMPPPVKIGGSLRWSDAMLKRWTAAGCPRVGRAMLAARQGEGD
jgi:predicted DNA-binding transcriptional regulator AlpA